MGSCLRVIHDELHCTEKGILVGRISGVDATEDRAALDFRASTLGSKIVLLGLGIRASSRYCRSGDNERNSVNLRLL